MYVMYHLYEHRHTGRGYSRVKLVWESPWDLFSPSASVWMIPGTYDELPMGDAYPTVQSVLDQKAFEDHQFGTLRWARPRERAVKEGLAFDLEDAIRLGYS